MSIIVDDINEQKIELRRERAAMARALRWAAKYSDDNYWPDSTLNELADRIERGEVEVP